MQPTVPQSAGAADMDLPAVQSMDWLFKKERIYLLAQFWQQRATLAEKEVNSLKEQLSSTSISSQNSSMQNGCLAPQSLASPTMSECSSSGNPIINSKSLNNNKDDLNDDKMDTTNENQSTSNRSSPVSMVEQKRENTIENLADDDDEDDDDIVPIPSTVTSSTTSSLIASTAITNASNALTNTSAASKLSSVTTASDVNDSEGKSSDDISAKDKEIVALVEEISRLRSALAALQESHNLRIQQLEERLESKRQHISRLESRLDKQSDYDDVKTENRSGDVQSESKQFQELLLERTKALAAQAEALKSNSDDDHGNRQDDKSSHHDASSTASTPILQDSRYDDNQNGGLTPMSLPISKSPQEDNNNHLGALPHGPSFPLGLPFHHQMQERPHFRFADELQMTSGSMTSRLGDSLIPKSDPMEAKLQEMLRYNMDKYANQNLDTLHISRRVRELLSVHNIGQRLFAKYVLGLSQGTVSELLSKPKPWDKLTEKGRDSYRKMHAWACDDNAVLLLKSLIPKKDSGLPPYGRGDDNSMGDDRIAHILSEASSMMKPSLGGSQSQMSLSQQQHNDDSRSNDDLDSLHNQSLSPFSKDARRMRKYDSDDISREKMARIYQEELAKLMTRDAFPNSLFPQFLSGGMPPVPSTATSQMPEDNIRMALEAYYRELAKLQQSGGNIPNFPNLPGLLALQQQALNGAQDLSLKKEQQAQAQANKSQKLNGQHSGSEEKDNDDGRNSLSAFNMVRAKPEPGTTPTTTASSAAPSPIGNSILPPAMTPTDDFSSAASPLQRMASITNSLITQAPMPNHHASAQRPLKAVLPPITQQQFDMFNNLNTEDIVRRVKEALSQYSISQRLFGESVLGLSQGSVSDLLARPKPWHMLTQKGREPFIRMKMFLEDENAVHKLVASQYKIAPEKLMRTGNYSGSPQIPSGIAKQMPPMQKMISEMSKMQQEQHLMHLQQLQMPSTQMQPPPSQGQSATSQSSSMPNPGMLLTPPGVPPLHRVTLPPEDKKPMPVPVHSPQQNNAMRSMHQHMSPTVYEMAALTQDMDTQTITTKIKEALMANNIGQKIFGEAVLGLSQGSVSELLSKPKPWHMLSIKGREPFIRMQLWLSDANNVDRLQALKNERREANKRRRSTGPGMQDNSSDTSSNDTSEFYASNSPGPGSVGSSGAPPNKKQRVLFSEEQKEALRLAFALDPYPNVGTIEFLATELGLSTRTITNWFHNHRMRLKQQVPHGAPSDSIPTRENQTGAPFDPVQFRLLLNQRLMELQKERIGLSGVPLQYPPFFANQNLAALIGRGLLPTNEAELAALNAFKEQMSGLDLSMGAGLKRERDDYSDDENDGDNNMSDGEDDDNADNKSESNKDLSASPMAIQSNVRSSRRKPAAPQWLNPMWQDDKKNPLNIGNNDANAANRAPTDDEVIINGVCVMQQNNDFDQDDSTVRIEPQSADRLDDEDAHSDDENDAKSTKNNNDMDTDAPSENDIGKANELEKNTNDKTTVSNDDLPVVKKESDDSDRWDY
ncbi:homeobox protein cut isoform X4 [Contarinia nasturtii]|uniref:homeobox protein cut isoform X4 n=1 Tax=Contarinia nasturtii TaxID=265458 RepID=UPI0012D38A9B|nr:homeobox protein cut isoform X4 [Contarinia nasturtii]